MKRVLSLIICLISRYKTLRYIVPLFIIKESFQLIAGGIRLRKHKMLKGALISGKICTTILFLSLIVMVMLPTLSERIVNIICAVDILFMTAALIEYMAAYFFLDSKFQSLDE